MGLTVGMVTIDCTDPQQLARFWSAALGVEIQADYGDYVFLQRPADGGPMLGLQRVPEPRAGKNRVHVDVSGPDVRAVEARVVALGGSRAAGYDDGGFLVMADPEGNEFCIVPGGSVRMDDEGRAHYLDPSDDTHA